MNVVVKALCIYSVKVDIHISGVIGESFRFTALLLFFAVCLVHCAIFVCILGGRRVIRSFCGGKALDWICTASFHLQGGQNTEAQMHPFRRATLSN